MPLEHLQISEERGQVEVSYAILEVRLEQDYAQQTEKISTAINVQSAFDGENLPFVPPVGFNIVQEQDKVFVVGQSGSGKSRCIFEIVKEKLPSFGKVVIINPRNTAATTQSGRGNLWDLLEKCSENDAVIWDNFPDDLLKRDQESARRVLEIISSRNLKSMLISLKPKYLEIYREIADGLPEIYKYEVAYDREQIKNIVRSYGGVSRFKELYNSSVSKDIDKISSILWQKEALPLTVLDFYNELSHNLNEKQQIAMKGLARTQQQLSSLPIQSSEAKTVSLDAISEAIKLPRTTQYYEHQFELMSSLQERKSDYELLYVVKLAYELGLDRTPTRIDIMQREIFGTTSSNLVRRLSTWIYLSGQYISMHDVCREAIKFDDFTKLKFTSYLIGHFSDVVSNNNDNNQIYLLGLYFGRNIQYVPRDLKQPFLPASLYQYMKSNRYFEKGLGQGIGEIFAILDEDLAKEILKRVDVDIEFAEALGDSLGLNFPNLSDRDREQILDRTSTSLPFARYFGQSLGRVLKHLPVPIQEEIFLKAKDNVQFTDGLGWGLGYVFYMLDADMRQQVLKKAESDSDFTRGIGFGFGRNFSAIDAKLHTEAFSHAENDGEFAMGLGMGLGSILPSLPTVFQEEIFSKAQTNTRLSFGWGIGVGYLFSFLDDAARKEFLYNRAASNNEFAYGIGMGLGYAFAYLPPAVQDEIFSIAQKDPQLSIGLGSGFGLIFPHLPLPLQEEIFSKAKQNAKFAEGLGWGLGYTYAFLSPDMRVDLFKRAQSNGSFARGIGSGLGYTFTHPSGELQDILFNQHSGTGNEMLFGLGIGIGYILLYINSESREKIFYKASIDYAFAEGLGYGIGRIFNYLLARGIKSEILAMTKKNPRFAEGLGSGLGTVFVYLNSDLQPRILEMADNYNNMALDRGLGIGFGLIFKNLSDDVRKQVFERSEKNIPFAIGLGIGLGEVFQYFNEDPIRTAILQKSEKNIPFAIGLGIGIGESFEYFDEDKQHGILAWIGENSGTARGVGIGFGKMFLFLSSKLRLRIIQEIEKDTQFAIGLGIGIGRILLYFKEGSRDDIQELYHYILKKTSENDIIYFARGLGEGLGSVFQYLRDDLQNIAIELTEKNGHFARGLGFGVGSKYSYLDVDLQNIAIELTEKNGHFARGLGEGLGFTHFFLKRDNFDSIVELRQHLGMNSRQFEFGAGFGLGHSFLHIQRPEEKELAFSSAAEKDELALGLGAGLGHSFPCLDESIREQILQASKRKNMKNFSEGLGLGLGTIFEHIDEITQRGLITRIENKDNNNDNIFARALLLSLAHNFPSLPKEIQVDLLAKANQNKEFAEILSSGLEHCFNYLDAGLQDQIINTLKGRDQQFAQTMQENLHTLGNKENFFDSVTMARCHDNSFIVVGSTPLSRDPGYDNTLMKPSLTVDNYYPLEEEVSFSGLRKNYCVCFIDMVSSTTIAAGLDETKLGKYYSIFLNSMATIVRNFGGKIIKNAGDALIYYFPETADSANQLSFMDTLECCITMVSAHSAINAKLYSEGLPPLNYRISVDYGQVELAKSTSSQSDDLFGSTMNMCAKINSKASPNSVVIGDNLYQIVRAFDEYSFEPVGAYSGRSTTSGPYLIYCVVAKYDRHILNPFKRKPIR